MYQGNRFLCLFPSRGRRNKGILVIHICQCELANADLKEPCLNQDFKHGWKLSSNSSRVSISTLWGPLNLKSYPCVHKQANEITQSFCRHVVGKWSWNLHESTWHHLGEANLTQSTPLQAAGQESGSIADHRLLNFLSFHFSPLANFHAQMTPMDREATGLKMQKTALPSLNFLTVLLHNTVVREGGSWIG